MPRNIYQRKRRIDGKVYNGMEAISDQVKWRPVLVTVRDNDAPVPAIVMQLHDELYKASGGKIPYDIIGFCPICGDNFQVTGEKRRITVDYLDRPQRLDVPVLDEATGKTRKGTFEQTANVTVEGVLTCPGDAVNGKGMCGYKFRIEDNQLYRIKGGKR